MAEENADNEITKKSEEKEIDPSLDQLLDDALEDFSKPAHPQENNKNVASLNEDSSTDSTSAWTDEFIKQATQNFETTMKCVIEQQQTTDKNENASAAENAQLDVREISQEFSKFAEAAAKAATEATNDKDFTHCLAQTMQQMTKNKEEAHNVPSADDLEKMFEQFGVGDSQNGGSDADGLFPLMQSMLENILSKEVLYHPIKEIVTKFPDWLADNRGNLSDAEFDRYSKQFSIMKQVTEKFENDQETDSDDVKAQTFDSVLKLMQKVQEYGHPPAELIGDQNFPLLDGSGNAQLPDLSNILSGVGFPTFGLGSDTAATNGSESNVPLPPGGNEQCNVM